MKKNYERIPTRQEAEKNVVHNCENCEFGFGDEKQCAAYIPWNDWTKKECPEWGIEFMAFIRYGESLKN